VRNLTTSDIPAKAGASYTAQHEVTVRYGSVERRCMV